MQHLSQSNTRPRTCNTLPGTTCSPAAPPSLQYYCTYFLNSILHLTRAIAVYIYIILKLPQLSWHFPLPGRRNFVLVHYSPTSRVPLHTRAPLVLVHHSFSCTSRAPLVLVHLSCTTHSRAPLVHHYSRAPIIKPTRCPIQEGSGQAHNIPVATV